MFANRRRFKRAFFGLSAILILTSACSGGRSSGGAPALAEAVATTLRPTPDGYSFANFAANGSPEEFGSVDLVEMFGEGELGFEVDIGSKIETVKYTVL